MLAVMTEEGMEFTHQVRDALLRIQTEYVEMPDLKLTPRQAERLWNLSHEVCQVALATLLASGFLIVAAQGAYVRRGAARISLDVLRQAS
jgi:hypothetical protein